MPLSTTLWDSVHAPINTTLDTVLADIRNDDVHSGLIYEPLSMHDILDNAAFLDAIVVKNVQLNSKMLAMKRVMNNAMNDPKLKVKEGSPQISDPFTKFGTANIAALFELEGGQTISVFFHNPDTTPRKITGEDMLISYKFLLNKKDVTIVVAPERGQDIDVRQVAVRILKLAEKNQAAFERRNIKRTEQLQRVAELKRQIEEKQQALNTKLAEIKRLEGIQADKELRVEVEQEERSTALQAVNSAYQFANATDEFKIDLFESLDLDDYSPFLSAKNIDSYAKQQGAELEWSVSDGWLNGAIKANGSLIGLVEMGYDGKAVIMHADKSRVIGVTMLGNEFTYLASESLDTQRNALARLFELVAEKNKQSDYVTFEPDGNEYLLYGRGKDGYEQILFKVENREHFEALKKLHADKIREQGFTDLREKVYQKGVFEKPDFVGAVGGNTKPREDNPVVLTGNELGDFDTSTKEGKEALREAAFKYLFNLAENDETVFCPALNANVRFTKSGAKKYKKLAGNPIKSKMAAKIKEIIAGAAKFKESQSSYDETEKQYALKYHYLKSTVIVDGEEYGARIVIREDGNGNYHYDLQIADSVELIVDSVQKETARSFGANKSPVSSRSSNELIATDTNNTFIFDNVQGEYVLNLFVTDKDGNLIEDEPLENEVQNENKPIALTGNELGEFDTTTEEGKKALREVAFNHLVQLAEKGESVFCPALNADVGFTKSGAKKHKRFAGNPIKSKMVAKIKEIIVAGRQFKSSEESYDKSEKLTYHYLKTAVMIDGEEYGARIVIREDGNGNFHYDLQVAENVALITDSVDVKNGGKPAEVHKAPVFYHRDDELLPVTKQGVLINGTNNTLTLDDASRGYVLNLFVYDKDGNLLDDEKEEPEINEKDLNKYAYTSQEIQATFKQQFESYRDEIKLFLEQNKYEYNPIDWTYIKSIHDGEIVAYLTNATISVDLKVKDTPLHKKVVESHIFRFNEISAAEIIDELKLMEKRDLGKYLAVYREEQNMQQQKILRALGLNTGSDLLSDEDQEQEYKNTDIQFLQDVIDGKIDVLADDFYPKFEEINTRLFETEPELVEKAVNAYISQVDAYAVATE